MFTRHSPNQPPTTTIVLPVRPPPLHLFTFLPPPPRLPHGTVRCIRCPSFDGLLDSPLLFPAEQAQLAEALTDAETQLRLDKEREQDLRDKEEEARGNNPEVFNFVSF